MLTDQGSEYRAGFDQACQALGARHPRTRPRHAWTKGFVDRRQGTILTDLWRVEFRRRFFTSVPMLQTALDRYLGVYNHHRPPLGYRTRGPATRRSSGTLLGGESMTTFNLAKVSTPMRNWTA